MVKSKKSQTSTQLTMDLDQSESTIAHTAKQRFYDVLVQLRDQESTDGHTAELITKAVKATGFRVTRTQARGVLKNLVFESHATSKIIAGRRRYFLGTTPYQRKRREHGVSTTVLRALKTLDDRKAPNSEGYTNVQIHQFMMGTGSNLTLGQVSRATSRCQLMGIIGMVSTNRNGHRTDVFRWTNHPLAVAALHLGATNPPIPYVPLPRSIPKPPQPPPSPKTSGGHVVQQLKMLHEQTRHLIGKALMSREIPPNARNEAFALDDAFDALLAKL